MIQTQLSSNNASVFHVADILMQGLEGIEIPRASITLDREIGQGEFGIVMHALAVGIPATTEITSVAVKVLKKAVSENVSNNFVREGLRLRDLRHENVVLLLATCIASEPKMLVLEYMAHGDLKALLRQAKTESIPLTESHLLKFSVDVCSGFEYLRRKGFIHRDLAARNVWISGTFQAKIGDFGL